MKSFSLYLFNLLLLLISVPAFAQIGIGTTSPAASAALEVSSTANNKGILIPRLNASQKDAIASPAEGLMVYQTTAPVGFYYYTSGAWKLMVTQTDLATKVDKVDGKNLSTNDYTTAEKTKLAAIIGSNTGDQDLSALASTASVALKAPIENPVFTGTPSLPSGTIAITQAQGDNSTKLATTAYADAAVAMALTLTSSGVADNSVTSAKIADGTIATDDIANAAITNEKISAVASSKITGVIPVSSGGTGETTVSGILSTLGFASNNIAIGRDSGTPSQGVNMNTVSIGGGAGDTNQGQSAIAIGYVSGNASQGANSLAIGGNAAQVNQGIEAVALGYAAGQNNQGAYSVALGSFAGNSQVAKSIAINASGTSLNPANAGFYVNPIRTAMATSDLLYYNTTTKEITSAAASFLDLNTNQSVGGLKTFNSIDGLLATGTYGTGTESSIGAGTRMMWYPKKSAFRAGTITGNKWDDAQIGNYSIAMGNNTTASGESSTAMGRGTISSGSASTAMGQGTFASGPTSTAMGYGSNASGSISTAMGYGSSASGSASTAMGYGSRASGNYSTAIGDNITAKSFAETVIGTTNDNYDPASTTAFNAADRLFVIGNGENGVGRNALVMLKNANTTIGGSLTVNGNGSSTSFELPLVRGTSGQVLTTDGSGVTSWTTVSGGSSSGVPYTGATGAVNLGAYDLTVNGLTIGMGTNSYAGNTSIGNAALSSLNNGSNVNQSINNTAVGFQALKANTTGDSNTANGSYVLYSNTTGIQNTASGMNALRRNIGGVNNTVSGMNALTYNIDGSNNSAFGQGTLYNNIGGQRNTANGGSSLYNNTSGNYNTASGFQALYTNATGFYNTAIGNGADVSVDGLTNSTAIGNGAIVSASNTIQLGNTDVTNVKTSGTITAGAVTYPKVHGTANQVLTTTGSGALTWSTSSSGVPYTNATGAVNLGAYDLTVNGLTIGMGTNSYAGNTSIGNAALSSLNNGSNVNQSINNTAVGFQALKANTTGYSNTAIGNATLSSNTSGFSNTANGSYVLYSNTTGIQNTASGMNALRRNIGGVNNTVSGMNALTYNIDGSNNSAFGQGTLYNNIGGQRNTANGGSSLYNNTSGNYNTASGFQALYTNATGFYNTAIGNGADVSVDGLTNSTAIGNGAIVSASNTIQLGNTDVTNVKTSGTITAGAVTYPRIDGAAGTVLTANANGIPTWAAASSGGTHTIGEAYGGGKVFYVTTDGLHGLIAETQDQSSSCSWYDAQNIISNSANHSTAGKLYTDWRLPTKHELNLLYLQRSVVGGFAGIYYWSSTEYSNSLAWGQYFGDGSQSSVTNTNTANVRAIRAF